MRSHIYLPFLVSTLVIASCATPKAIPTSNNVVDARLGIDQCPVHGEPLIENLQKLDRERGSYDPLYYRLRETLFPCAYMPPQNGDLALVTYCPKCRAAKVKCNSDPDCDPLYSALPTDDAAREQYRRDLDAFIERQKRELDEEYELSR